jgi:hypothetical protein
VGSGGGKSEDRLVGGGGGASPEDLRDHCSAGAGVDADNGGTWETGGGGGS